MVWRTNPSPGPVMSADPGYIRTCAQHISSGFGNTFIGDVYYTHVSRSEMVLLRAFIEGYDVVGACRESNRA